MTPPTDRPTGPASIDYAAAAACRPATEARRIWYRLARAAWLSGKDAPKLRHGR
jgi:hypothetical protein